jgi:thiol-disulfide isomerase/thioredoxin
MRTLFLFLGLIGTSSLALSQVPISSTPVKSISGAKTNQFMWHLVEPWYVTEDIEKKRDIGNLVLIDFFATFCAPCKSVTNKITEVKDKYPEKVSVLIIAPDMDIEKLKKYQSNLKYKSPTHYDPNGRSNKYRKEWGALLGHVYTIDQNGLLSDIHGQKNLAQKVERLLLEG